MYASEVFQQASTDCGDILEVVKEAQKLVRFRRVYMLEAKEAKKVTSKSSYGHAIAIDLPVSLTILHIY